MNMKCQLTYLDPGVGTHFTETIRVSELGSGYKILTINASFHCNFFNKQTPVAKHSLCHVR